MNRTSIARPLYGAGILMLMLTGCGKPTPPAPLVPVTGQIVFNDGPPIPWATVDFHPDTPDATSRVSARAMTDEDGHFTLETYPYGAGAMRGRYRVTVMYYTRGTFIPRPYTKLGQTPLRANIKPDGNSELVLQVIR